MAAVVDGEHAVAGLGQRVVGAVPVEVGAEHPAVQEQHGRAVAAGVADEQLAAAGDMDDAAARQRERRLGGPAGHRREPATVESRGHAQHLRGRSPGSRDDAPARPGVGGRAARRTRSRAVVVGRDARCWWTSERLALVPLRRAGAEPLLLGVQDGRALFAVDGDAGAATSSSRCATSRRELAQDEGGLIAYAAALLNWHRRHRFCSVCGAPSRGRARPGCCACCPACGAEHHPRTDPVVIMLVVDEERDRVLLGRQPSWPPAATRRWRASSSRARASRTPSPARCWRSRGWRWPARVMTPRSRGRSRAR